MITVTKGNIVRIGKGLQFWKVANITPGGDALIVAMSKQPDGTFERTRYIPGHPGSKVIHTDRLTFVAESE